MTTHDEAQQIQAEQPKHTPGPWTFKPTASHSQGVVYSEADPSGRDIAIIYDRHTLDGHLIAAAPELLAVCHKALAAIPTTEWQLNKEIRAVIRQAEGK